MNKKFLSIVVLLSTFALSAADGQVPTTASSWNDVPFVGGIIKFWSNVKKDVTDALQGTPSELTVGKAL